MRLQTLWPTVALALTVAFTAAAVTPSPATTRAAGREPTRVLIVAGGTSHDFKRWFEEYDAAVLTRAGFAVTTTEDPAAAAAGLDHADVAIVSTNQVGFDTPAVRAALFAFVARGHGLVLLHPAVWYNYDRWPAYNARLVGGGTRSHDPIAPFTVAVLEPDHPVMAGVPGRFDVTDELYHINATTRPADTVPIDVLAQTSPSRRYHTPHPTVWIPHSDAGRIVCVAIGHDGRVHQLDVFRTVLVNAVKWTAGS